MSISFPIKIRIGLIGRLLICIVIFNNLMAGH